MRNKGAFGLCDYPLGSATRTRFQDGRPLGFVLEEPSLREMEEGLDPVLLARFERAISRDPGVQLKHVPFYIHWAKTYLWFCRSTGLDPDSAQSVVDFTDEMSNVSRPKFMVDQARKAVAKLLALIDRPVMESQGEVAPQGALNAEGFRDQGPAGADLSIASNPISNGPVAERTVANGLDPADSGTASETRIGAEPALADWEDVRRKLESEIQLRHYSRKTLKTYAHWITAFSRYLRMKNPGWVDSEDAKGFLVYLAVERKIAASTQNQAFNALMFLFNRVLGIEVAELEGTPRAKKAMNVPDVLSREEVTLLLELLGHPYDLFFTLTYGCGLRLSEGLSLRIQDIDFQMGYVTVHRGKGGKSRKIPLPKRLMPKLKIHLAQVRSLFEEDAREKTDGVFLPEALERKMPGAPREWPWYWVFPAKERTWTSGGARFRRYHLHESLVQKALKEAVDKSEIAKRISAHTFRHSYATHLLMMGTDIRTLQELMGHGDVKTTMIYTQAVRQLSKGPMNPLDWQ